MARILKYLGIAFGSVIGLIVLLVVALLLFIDPNNYKPQLISVVKQRTGMDLVLNDKLAWTFWPAIGVKLGKLSLTDPQLHEQLLGTDNAMVSVQLLPLLSKQIAVNAVQLDGATLRRVQYADGSTSWDHMLNKLKSPAPASGASVKLSVSKLAISNTSLTLVNDKAKTSSTVTDIDVQASNIAPDADFPLAVTFMFTQTTPGNSLSTSNAIKTMLRMNPAFDHFMLHGLSVNTALSGAGGNLAMPDSIALTADVDADLTQKHYQIDKLALNADYKPMLGKAFSLTLNSNISANLKDGIFAVAPLSFGVLDLQAKGTLNANIPALAANATADTAITNGMSITGNISTNTFNLRQLMSAFNLTVPTTTDPAALSQLSLRADIAGSSQSMLLKNIQVVLDGSTLSGEAGISDLASNQLHANLNIDKFNLDGYLPPAATDATPDAAAPDAPTTGLLPVDLIRQQNMDIALNVASLTALTYPVTQFRMTASAAHGLVTVSDFKGSIAGGNFSLPASINVQGEQPVVSVKPVVDQIEAGPIAQEILQKKLFEGTLSLNGGLTMTGNSVDSWKHSLSGPLKLTLKNGVMHGVNMMQLALAGKNAAAATSGQGDTSIGELESVATINNGLVTQTPIKADLQKAQMSGSGTFNLATLDADYHLLMNLDHSVPVPKSAGYDIPIRCKGNIGTATEICSAGSN